MRITNSFFFQQFYLFLDPKNFKVFGCMIVEQIAVLWLLSSRRIKPKTDLEWRMDW